MRCGPPGRGRTPDPVRLATARHRGRVGLFIPCYVDPCYPNVGLATVDLLERYGVEVDYPEAQTCCGQPMANSGMADAARALAERFVRIFGDHEHVVCPSGSCAAMVRVQYRGLLGEESQELTERIARVARSTRELWSS